MAGPGMSMVIVRVRAPNGGEEEEWKIPTDCKFRDVLESLSKVVAHGMPTAFDYEDEVGDVITVRTDDELAAMIQFCQWRTTCGVRNAVVIHPRATKAPSMRNKLNLVVNTRLTAPGSSKSSSGSNDSLTVPTVQTRKASAEALFNLLSNGQISPQDLNYLEMLGHGASGTVYRAIHTTSKTIMATKIIPLDATVDERRKIMTELEILHKCDSKYIIGFFGSFFHEERMFICTEYMDGGSLDQYTTIPEQVLGRIAVGMVRGLSYLSSLKVMHRDIKPSNVLVNTYGSVKLCDFGVSVQLLTSMAKTFIGSNAYMAPERITGEAYGLHSDIWSLGITVFELAIGKFPYLTDGVRANSMMPIELLQCIVNEKPPQLPTQSFSTPFVDFIAQCMQKAPKSRPGIEGLLRHPFILMNEENLNEIVGPWVIFMLDQFRMMKRYPSDTSLSSASSHGSGHFSAGVQHTYAHHSSSTSLEQMDT